MMMNDPNNSLMNEIKFGGDQALQQVYQFEIRQSIAAKKLEAVGKPDEANVFLNSLNQQEYFEFMSNSRQPEYHTSGAKSESIGVSGQPFLQDPVLQIPDS
jgi:hypothetical protein